MSRKVLLFSMVVICLSAFGQTGASNPQPANTSQTWTPAYPAQPIPIGNGLSWNGGTVGYYGEGVAGGILMSTPTATLDLPQPAAGISDAGRAGISNSQASQSMLSGSNVVYTSVGPEVIAMGTMPAPASPEQRTYDFGPSFYSNQVGGVAPGQSLAQVAEHYRALQSTLKLRTYTNADVRPPRNSTEVQNGVLAENKPPVLPLTASAPAVSAGHAAVAAPETAAQNQGTQPQAQGSGTSQLPATASPLPLLGCMGLVMTGLGLCLKGKKRA
jgi:hypothetical protein